MLYWLADILMAAKVIQTLCPRCETGTFLKIKAIRKKEDHMSYEEEIDFIAVLSNN